MKDEGGRPLLDDVSFTIHRGEILGVAGVEGNGQTELIEAIIGIAAARRGTIVLGGERPGRGRHPGSAGSAGSATSPRTASRTAWCSTAPLWENVLLGHQTQRAVRQGPVDRPGGALAPTPSEIIDEFDVRTPGPDVAALALSGGNQQKLIVGREMTAEPRCSSPPTPPAAIDVGAQADIWEDLRKARAAGLAVLLVSADLEELIGLSDTLVVFLRGRVVATLDPATVTPVDLGSYMTGAREAQGAA